MILKPSAGWQTLTADLALILFLVTAQSVADNPDPVEPQDATFGKSDEGSGVPAASSALAVHRPSQGEDVREWLMATAPDSRQVATILINYSPDRREIALAEGERLLADAEAAGVNARLVAMPDTKTETLITIDFLSAHSGGTVLAY